MDIAEWFLYIINFLVIPVVIVHYLNKVLREKLTYYTVDEYLFAGKEKSIVTISLALIGSHITSTTLIGIPIEIFLTGTNYLVSSCCAIVIVTFLTAIVYLPVFHRKQLTSCFEYLEMRFSSKVRYLAVTGYIISKILLMTMATYIPLKRLREDFSPVVTHLILIICITCAALIAIAGLRAIITIAICTTLVGLLGIIVPSVVNFNDMDPVLNSDDTWKLANSSGRLVIYNDPDPNVYHHLSFFLIFLDLSMSLLWKVAVDQESIQKLLAVKKLSKAIICLGLSCLGVLLIQLLAAYFGLRMYAWFENAGLEFEKEKLKDGQIVQKFLHYLSILYPGITSVFEIAIFTATTGCLASSINSLSAVIGEDLLRQWNKETTEMNFCKYVKVLCGVVGGLIYGITLIIEYTDSWNQYLYIATSVIGVTTGTLLGLFTLGIVFRRANHKGALCGCFLSVVLCTILVIFGKNMVASAPWVFEAKLLPFYSTDPRSALHLIGFVSNYCPFVGALIVILVGVLVSCFIGKSKYSDHDDESWWLRQRYHAVKSSNRNGRKNTSIAQEPTSPPQPSAPNPEPTADPTPLPRSQAVPKPSPRTNGSTSVISQQSDISEQSDTSQQTYANIKAQRLGILQPRRSLSRPTQTPPSASISQQYSSQTSLEAEENISPQRFNVILNCFN